MDGKRTWKVAGTACVLAAVVSVGVAGALDDGNTIHACAKSQTGTLRVVASPGDCLASESPIEWNKQGPQGVPGPAGPAGPAGVSGYEMIQETVTYEGDTGVGKMLLCPSGKRVLGGGFQVLGVGEPTHLPYLNRPVDLGVTGGWAVSISKGSADGELTVYAICANVN